MGISNTEEIVRGIWGAALANDRMGMRERIDMYRDKWEPMIKAELKKQFSKTSMDKLLPLITTECNIVKKVTDETAMVYKNAPQRTVKVNDEDVPRWREIEQEAKANLFWKENNKYTRLCNHTLTKVVSRNRKIEYDLYTPDAFPIFA